MNSFDSVSVYVHWPYCLSKCPYCDFNSYVAIDNINYNLWQTAYLNEVSRQSIYLKNKFIKTIFFGGGTPSLMDPNLVASIISAFKKLNKGQSINEITLECNPSSIEIQKLKLFQEAGVNRLSIGVQSFHKNNLKFLGRNHSAKEALTALEKSNSIFNNVSFDLINGLPHQSLEDWIMELKIALLFITSHISIYELTIEPNTPFFKLSIPPVKSNLAIKMYNHTMDTLIKNNIYPYEISNYAKKNKASLHNLQYWLGGLYLGIGPGAHGRIATNGNIYATESVKNPQKWLTSAINCKSVFSEFYKLSNQQRILELLILNLRLYREILPVIIKSISAEAIHFLLQQQLMIKKLNQYYLTQKGRLQLNSIINYLSTQIMDSTYLLPDITQVD